jgi:alpha-beta hydrolase superfamily lysophospholipase
MFKRSEFFFQGAHKSRLFCQMWEPAQVKGHMIITHGQAEHSGCYQRLVEGLKNLSYTIYAWDLRGHGRSDGKRGYVSDFSLYTKDFQLFLQKLRNEKNLYPNDFVLIGHSMGGLVQMMTQLENPHWLFRAQVLSSPMLGIAVDVPLYKDLAALVFSKVLPTVTLNNEIRYEDLTQDSAVLKEFKSDVLRHHRISSAAYLGAISAIETLRQEIGSIKTPTLFQIPTDDPIVGSESSRRFFKSLGSPNKVLIEYPNRKHEIYNDVGREETFDDIQKFLTSLNS